MIGNEELAMRVLVTLEEAGSERLVPLLNTIIQGAGGVEEVSGFQEALRRLLASAHAELFMNSINSKKTNGANMSARREILMPASADVSQAFKLETKAVFDDGTFEGYASVFNRRDMRPRRGRCRAPSATSLGARGASGIRMLFQHDPTQPIGVWEELYEDARGLYARGRLTTEVARAREVLALMRSGAIDGLSIGFRTVKGRATATARALVEIDLWEISVVTFPMLPEARIRQRQGAIVRRRDADRPRDSNAGSRRTLG